MELIDEDRLIYRDGAHLYLFYRLGDIVSASRGDRCDEQRVLSYLRGLQRGFTLAHDHGADIEILTYEAFVEVYGDVVAYDFEPARAHEG